jgi:predicted metal-dependent phosphoesterase TrpH
MLDLSSLGDRTGLKWETHCHTVYSNRRRRRFDALNTPREMIEAAISKGLGGMIITDHDSVKGGIVGKANAREYKGFKVLPGAEVTSRSGHILAIGIVTDVPKGLSVEETVEKIHDLGGIAIASHPFSSRVRPSLGEECLKADGVEVFNATNRGRSNSSARALAQEHGRPGTAGSDAHWVRTVGSAGIVCDNPIEDIVRGRVGLFGEYASMWDMRSFNFRQLASSLINKPLWK